MLHSSPLSSVHMDDEIIKGKPYVNGAITMMGGEIKQFYGPIRSVFSPILDQSTGCRIVMGKVAQMTVDDALESIRCAQKAWDCGMGEWPQASFNYRIQCVERLMIELKNKRDDMIQILMWEICKTFKDASSEFDRTIEYIEATIAYLRKKYMKNEVITQDQTKAYTRQNAVGIMFIMGPFNYPFNETYTSLIPALLMGNIIILKIPSRGGLTHYVTMTMFAKLFPPGVVNFISGPGREIAAPIMKSGIIDLFSFVGSCKVANLLLQIHPNIHRLRTWLSLEGKNMAIIASDANVQNAVSECLKGCLTFNGQRCTAIKIIFVHDSIISEFLTHFISAVEEVHCGLPWDEKSQITPLLDPNKLEYLSSLLNETIAKGASVLNDGGGEIHGMLMKPAIIYPVTYTMRIWYEEQFGPLVPIATYHDINEVHEYIRHTPYGLQASIFSTSALFLSHMVDILSTAVGRININCQCARSPDILPFTGRKNSALGTMSLIDSLHAFSIETVIAYIDKKEDENNNNELIENMINRSQFLLPIVSPSHETVPILNDIKSDDKKDIKSDIKGDLKGDSDINYEGEYRPSI